MINIVHTFRPILRNSSLSSLSRSSYLTQLRVGLTKLCFHKFRHNFRDTVNPMCPTNDGIETTEHFFLLYPSFEAERRSLLADVFDLIHPFGCVDLSNEVLLQLLLYGDKNLSFNLNKCILELIMNYIHMTGRFGCVKQ